MHRVYEDCDPAYLRQLREAQGLEVMALARTACLSVAQVRHLEGEGEGMFYTLSIKRQAYKRLMMILGAEPPMAKPEEAAQAAQHGLDPLGHQAIERIVALAEDTQPMQHTSATQLVGLLGRALWLKVAGLGLVLVIAVGAVYLAYDAEVSDWLSAFTTRDTALASSGPPDSVPQAVAEPAPEPAVAPLPPAASGAAPQVAVVATPPKVAANCAYTADALPELSVPEAHKAGNYVYLASDQAMTLCVVDGAQQATPLELKPGEGRSVYGKSPWQVSGAQLSQVQVYFQGRRLVWPEGKPQRVVLVETPLSR